MFIKTEYVKTQHVRKSKLGQEHTYYRQKSMVVLRCDSCQVVFTRERGRMDPNRLNNNYYHVCGNCDVKSFAQKKGLESKSPWDIPVSSLKTLDQF